MHDDPVKSLIERHQKRLAVAQQLQALIIENPWLIDELRREFEGNSTERRNGNGDEPAPPVVSATPLAPSAPSSRPDRPAAVLFAARTPPAGRAFRTHFETVRDHLTETGNRWSSTSELAGQTGLTRESVSRVLYKSHREHFEHRPRPGAGETRIKDWRLKTTSQGTAVTAN